MGLIFSTIHEALMGFFSLKARIVMVGLDAAGKTTICYRLKLNETVNTIPTVAFNVETMEPIGNVSFTVWDLSSQVKIRPLWKRYCPGADGLVFVVDSTDLERFEEAKSELWSIINVEELTGAPFVVFANKQDLPGAKGASELTELLGLEKLQGHEWHVQGCCATTGAGLVEGLEKLAAMVKQNRKIRIL